MKSIYFIQQRQFDYMPLKAHLGMISEQELYEYNLKYVASSKQPFLKLCPKQLTTRPHRLNGRYYVVEGGWFDKYPVMPEIRLEAVCAGQLDLQNKTLDGRSLLFPDRFAEADLGIAGKTFEDFVNVILKLNKKHTINTRFYITKLFPINNSNSKPEGQDWEVLSTAPNGEISYEKR